jgi:hypothetical protein
MMMVMMKALWLVQGPCSGTTRGRSTNRVPPLDGLMILDHPIPLTLQRPWSKPWSLGVISIGRMRLVLETWNLVETHWNTLQFTMQETHEQELWLADDFKEFLVDFVLWSLRLTMIQIDLIVSNVLYGLVLYVSDRLNPPTRTKVNSWWQLAHFQGQYDLPKSSSEEPEAGCSRRKQLKVGSILSDAIDGFKSFQVMFLCECLPTTWSDVQLTLFLQTKKYKAPQRDIQLMNRLSWTCIGPCCHCQSFRHVWRCHG